jgi:hypothetical protein
LMILIQWDCILRLSDSRLCLDISDWRLLPNKTAAVVVGIDNADLLFQRGRISIIMQRHFLLDLNSTRIMRAAWRRPLLVNLNS